ncbi:MAG: proton-conducting transporter membrane subunit, partial [Armatimonadota bacterium]|nr:proton-conducting transporter membrane subunit [Armatimonadota bacterium]
MIFQWMDLTYLAPEMVVFLGAVLVLMLDLVIPHRGKTVLSWVALAVLVTALAAALAPNFRVAAALGPRPFAGLVVRDIYSLFFDVVFLFSGALAVLLSMGYARREGLQQGEYYALLLFAVLGMMLMAVSAELFSLVISYEILSLSVYVLCGIARGKALSAEASMKYFLLGAFASGFLIYGVALVYGATGTTLLEGIRAQVTTRGLFGNGLLLAGLALITVG